MLSEYNFIAKDKEGVVVKGSLQAKSRYEAVSVLKTRDLTALSISSLAKEEPKSHKSSKTLDKKSRFLSRSRISLTESFVFWRQLSVCINSGINLLEALESIAQDMENPYFRGIIFDVIDDIRGGLSFHNAMANYNKAFSPLFCILMKAAEESGSMPILLGYLSSYLEKTVSLHRKIRSITAYPIFVAVFFVIVVLIVTFFVLPRFENIFSTFGARLPKITIIVFSINRFIIRNIHIFIIGFIGIIWGVFLYGRTPKGEYNIDRLKLKVPLLGDLIKKLSLARFCRVLAIMIRGGVPIVTAMTITAQACANKELEQSIIEAKDQIVAGWGIASSLEDNGHFPNLMLRMIGIGESSGRLPEVLENISHMYEEEVDGSVMVITSIFEPIVIVAFGGVILILVLAIYVPLFTITLSIK